MKILAIRGKNLASLAGEFVVDFQQEPLASTGLFAISGPTGAGKSTLLDALCLALYDATPRLARASGRGVSLPDVGDDTITPQDPRNLLRRGAAEGFAEVDFIANDGLAYRSRWNVRRARGQAGGKLQNTDMALTRLGDELRIGTLKSEVLGEIRNRLGLNFDQFTRAVLLAQNEFSAFLKAPDDERASLLETLTGTDLYSGISKRAFERAKAEAETLKHHQSQLAEQQPLAAETRAELERDQAETQTAAARLEKDKGEIEGRLRWHVSRGQLQQGEQQASAALEQALGVQSAAEPRLKRLSRIDAVQEARPKVAELDRAKKELENSRQALVAAEKQQAEAEEKRREADVASAQARQSVTAAEQAKLSAADALNLARKLDAEIGTIEPSHAQAWQLSAQAEQGEAEFRSQRAAKQTERVGATASLAESQAWLESNSALELLSIQWARWDALLTQAGKTLGEVDDAEAAVKKATRAEAERRQSVAEAEEQAGKAKTALQAAETHWQAAEQAFSAFDAETLARSRKAGSERRELLKAGESLWKNRTALNAQKIEQETRRKQLRKELREAETALDEALAIKPRLATALDQAERSLKLVETACAESVEQLRAHLEDACPCPVCGATEHPYARENPRLNAALAELAVEVRNRREELTLAERQDALRTAQAETARKQLAELAQAQEKLDSALEQAATAWQAHPLAADLEAIFDDRRLDWFADQLVSAEEQISTLEASEAALRMAGKARDNAQQHLDLARKQHMDTQNALLAARAAFEQAVQALKTESEKLVAARQRLEENLAGLDGAFGDRSWREPWRDDTGGFHRQCRESASRWLAQREAADKLQNKIGLLDTEIASLEQALAKAAEQTEGARANYAGIALQLQDKQGQRQWLFEGRAVADVEAGFDRAIEAAKAASQKLETVAREAINSHARCVEVLLQAKKRAESCQVTAATAETALAGWLASFNAQAGEANPLDLAQLCDLLTHDSQWIAAERKALAEIDGAVLRAGTVLKERQEKRETHEREWPTPEPLETLQAALAQNLNELQGLKDRLSEIAMELRKDDERRQTSSALLEKLLKQEAAWQLWAQLSELIGSADGKKFRNYAQQLTLDVLLGYANRHLAELTHRYRLERVRETLALQVLDQDMGDEIRSVHSLSGGESFLVSLALALGLASLSSNRVRVESLFIDEGFGSLDADTLRVALDALDNLQSLGRKVGVISHVQEMTERIGTRIQVKRSSGGLSRVMVEGS